MDINEQFETCLFACEFQYDFFMFYFFLSSALHSSFDFYRNLRDNKNKVAYFTIAVNINHCSQYYLRETNWMNIYIYTRI